MDYFYLENQNFITNHQLKVLDEHKKLLYLINLLPNQLFITLPKGTKLISTNQKNFLFESEIELNNQQNKMATLKQVYQGKHSLYYLSHLHWLVTGDVIHQNLKAINFGRTVLNFQKNEGTYYRFSINTKDNVALAALIITIIDHQRLNPIHAQNAANRQNKKELCWEFFNFN